MRNDPLEPLESETVLVQSNGISQWLKLALADQGVAMGLEVTLPARLQWRLYRSVPGGTEIPRVSPFDTERLVWRVMRLLPRFFSGDYPEFALLRRFLERTGDISCEDSGEYLRRSYQLALRIADLFDQYQVYRADWLTDWVTDLHTDRAVQKDTEQLHPEDRWQPLLWRALVEDTAERVRGTDRGTIHQRFLEYTRACDLGDRPVEIPRRVVVFGISAMPAQTIEVLHAISRFSRVLFFVHNPCRYQWADIVGSREQITGRFFRSARKPGLPQDVLPEDELHMHVHPLLSAWGLQGRDYIALLDRFTERDERDTVEELFRSPQTETLLGQLQNDVFELRSVAESQALHPALPATDFSIRFHVAHSPLREVEILHDQILDAFERDPALRPRDIMVMVPDIAEYGSLIAAVFGRLDYDDPRFIPFTVSDQGTRASDSNVRALELFLTLPRLRLELSDLLGLLETPAVSRRFGIDPDEIETLERWAVAVGIRWGIDGNHRRDFGVPAGIEQNTWRFGLRRMLLGYAVGSGDAWHGIVPFEEIGGTDAELVGRLWDIVTVLDRYRVILGELRTPEDWTAVLGSALNDFFLFEEPDELRTMDALYGALQQWRDACGEAGYEGEIPVSVVREAWLGQLDTSRLTQRFLGGAVNFATLMPMRAIPFRMICLLGMNDGSYPRRPVPLGFDLMQRPGEYRPGDRSRRDDDRYLFLEALLSARSRLYISWVGFSISDNSPRPPSVLVGHLRDHIATVHPEVHLSDITTEHPLQPFSAAYYRGEERLFTYVHEWRSTETQETAGHGLPAAEFISTRAVSRDTPREITLQNLRDLLRNPVRVYFQERLDVDFESLEEPLPHDEPFEPIGIEEWQLKNDLIHAAIAAPETPPVEHMRHLALSGRVPVPPFDTIIAARTVRETEDVLRRYDEETRTLKREEPRSQPCLVTSHSNRIILKDEITDVSEDQEDTAKRVFLTASRIHDGHRSYRWEKLVGYWPYHLAAQISGRAVFTVVVALHGTVTLPPIPPERARTILMDLLEVWEEGCVAPLPAAPAASCAWVEAGGTDNRDVADAKARAKLFDGFRDDGELQRNRYLGRVWSDADTILRMERFAWCAEHLYQPLIDLFLPHARETFR